MDWYDWFWVILLVSIVFAVIIIPHVYAVDKMETMGVYHKDNPITCIMLPSSELEERFYTDILNISIEVVWQWQNSMYVYTKELPHNNPNGWNLPIKSIVYEKHFDKSVLDFPDCNIFLEFAKHNRGQHIDNHGALGFTQMDFSKSRHQWAFIMTYLEATKTDTSISLCIGCEENKLPSANLNSELELVPLDNATIYRILSHEYGHALGIGHYLEDRNRENNVPSLMYPIMNPFGDNKFDMIPVADLETLRQIYGNDGFGGFEGTTPRSFDISELIIGMVDVLNFMEQSDNG